VKDLRQAPDYPGSGAEQLPATASGTHSAVPQRMTTLALLRAARITGETIAAVDHLLQLGYAPSRAERAIQPYADPITQAYRLLSRADQEAAAQAASDAAIERRLNRDERPLAWAYLQIAVAAEIADATRDALEHDAVSRLLVQRSLSHDEQEVARAAEAHRQLDAAADRASMRWRDSDEIREYAFGGESLGGGRERGHAHAPSDVEAALTAWTEGGDWDTSEGTFWVHDHAWQIDPVTREELDDDRVDVSVAIEPAAPDCTDGHEHDWRSPHSVLGGLRENPGVWGKSGGVIIRMVCAHCGTYRVRDTWAQDGAIQGLESVAYEDADDDSLPWVAARRASAQREQVVDACRAIEADPAHDHLPRYLDGRTDDLERVGDDEWQIVHVGSAETTDDDFDELVRLLADKLGRGWRIAWERSAEDEATITLDLRS
jgi:hypothetical protein